MKVSKNIVANMVSTLLSVGNVPNGMTNSSSLIDAKRRSLKAEISLETVSFHDNKRDCWIVIYDRIYDITNFLDEVSAIVQFSYI